ncbi:MAG: phage head spike fiber domain-containing protein [Hyphomicrobiaceae bacterium]
MMGSMMRRAMLGDGSTLSLDFTQMSTLADLTIRGFTFSRSTSGTFINANGLVATATAGNPRFEYDPNGNPRGILIEGNATNLVYHSDTFRLTAVATEPFWADSASLSRGNDTAPDGTANAAVNFVAIGTAGTVIQTAAVGTSANRTFSFWARRTGGGTVEYTLDNGSTWTAVTITANWVRYTATATNANQRVGFRVATGTGTSIWGAQLEAGSGSSSYIPSGASQGSRAFDFCVMENITSCNYSTKTGTIFYAGRFTQMNASSFPNRVGFTRETGDFRTFAALSTTTALLPCFSNSGTTVLTTQNITLNSELKLAVSFDADLSTAEVKSSLNGGAIVQSGASALTESSVPTYFMFGQKGYGAFFPHGTVRSVKYWPTVLPTAQLQALTT